MGIVTSLLLLFALSSSQPRVVISEIHPHRDSGEQFRSEPQMRLPPEAFADTGQLRVRVRYRDNTGRWSHWSEPVPLTGR